MKRGPHTSLRFKTSRKWESQAKVQQVDFVLSPSGKVSTISENKVLDPTGEIPTNSDLENEGETSLEKMTMCSASITHL